MNFQEFENPNGTMICLNLNNITAITPGKAIGTTDVMLGAAIIVVKCPYNDFVKRLHPKTNGVFPKNFREQIDTLSGKNPT